MGKEAAVKKRITGRAARKGREGPSTRDRKDGRKGKGRIRETIGRE